MSVPVQNVATPPQTLAPHGAVPHAPSVAVSSHAPASAPSFDASKLVHEQILHMQHEVAPSHGAGHLLVVLVVLVGLVYVAYRFKLVPKSVLNAVGLAAVLDPAAPTASSTTTASTAPKEGDEKTVTGSVVFEGASAAAARVSCANYGGCQIKVDPCKLVSTTMDGSPVCHTVGSLCSSRTVPWIDDNRMCSLQERGWLDHAGTDKLKGVQVPQGINVDVNKGGACDESSEFSDVCTLEQGCSWTSPNYYKNYGMQFGVAPGYKLTCGQTTHYGPKKA